MSRIESEVLPRALTQLEKLQAAKARPELRGKFRAALETIVGDLILTDGGDPALVAWARANAAGGYVVFADWIHDQALRREGGLLDDADGATDADVVDILTRYLPKVVGLTLARP